MAEEWDDPQAAARRKARYRFEYERRLEINVPAILGVVAAVILAGLVGLRALKPKAEPRTEIALVAPSQLSPPPQVMVATRPVRVELPPVRAPAPSARPVEPAPVPPPAPVIAAAPAAMAPPPAPPASAPALPSPGENRLVALAAAAPPPDPCASIRNTLERLICSDPAVRAADQRIDAAYRNAMLKTDNPRMVERDHARWMARRATLTGDRAAVLAAYDRRYSELSPVPMRVGPRLPPIVKPAKGS